MSIAPPIPTELQELASFTQQYSCRARLQPFQSIVYAPDASIYDDPDPNRTKTDNGRYRRCVETANMRNKQGIVFQVEVPSPDRIQLVEQKMDGNQKQSDHLTTSTSNFVLDLVVDGRIPMHQITMEIANEICENLQIGIDTSAIFWDSDTSKHSVYTVQQAQMMSSAIFQHFQGQNQYCQTATDARKLQQSVINENESSTVSRYQLFIGASTICNSRYTDVLKKYPSYRQEFSSDNLASLSILQNKDSSSVDYPCVVHITSQADLHAVFSASSSTCESHSDVSLYTLYITDSHHRSVVTTHLLACSSPSQSSMMADWLAIWELNCRSERDNSKTELRTFHKHRSHQNAAILQIMSSVLNGQSSIYSILTIGPGKQTHRRLNKLFSIQNNARKTILCGCVCWHRSTDMCFRTLRCVTMPPSENTPLKANSTPNHTAQNIDSENQFHGTRNVKGCKCVENIEEEHQFDTSDAGSAAHVTTANQTTLNDVNTSCSTPMISMPMSTEYEVKPNSTTTGSIMLAQGYEPRINSICPTQGSLSPEGIIKCKSDAMNETIRAVGPLKSSGTLEDVQTPLDLVEVDSLDGDTENLDQLDQQIWRLLNVQDSFTATCASVSTSATAEVSDWENNNRKSSDAFDNVSARIHSLLQQAMAD